MTFDERELVAAEIVWNLAEQIQRAGQRPHEVACVLLHAVAAAEEISRRAAKATGLPDALGFIDATKVELAHRRAP